MRNMKDLDLRTFSINDVEDVNKFFKGVEYGLKKSVIVMRRISQSNAALKSINASIMKKNQKLESMGPVGQTPTDGDSVIESIEEEEVVKKDNTAVLGISEEEAIKMMMEASEEDIEETEDAPEVVEEAIEEEEVIEETPAEEVEENLEEEEELGEAPKEITFQWPRLGKKALEAMFNGVKADRLFNKSGQWYGLVDSNGNGVSFAPTTYSLVYLTPTKSRYKTVDAPESIKKIGEENIKLLIELAFVAFKTPKTFDITRMKPFFDDKELEEIFSRKDVLEG